ncbi:AAA family ATPase [Pedobacter foliorum]|uniref:AAA family ATPase n=1 Tax=Pedobacter foliorum TaxID=2739058 RepID=UPI0015632CC4|nr:AAA family ATPase [Pedobacter foliorum]NRF37606.1 AAA family ATPase [Pedobacter foliorum]
MKFWKLGANWGKGAPDFFEMIKKHRISLGHTNDGHAKKGDFIIITRGFTVYAITQLLEDASPASLRGELEEDFIESEVPFDDDVLVAKSVWHELVPRDRFSYNLQTGICQIHKPEIISTTLELYRKYKENMEIEEHLSVLKYKKQIILQGPPGTGKTRLAKQLGISLISETVKDNVSLEDLQQLLTLDLVVETTTRYNSFTITKVNNESVYIHPKNGMHNYKVSLEDIINCAKDFKATDQIKKYDAKGVGTYIVSLANYCVEQLSLEKLKVIQFHPSFSYEDFVRGIVTRAENGLISYEVEDKILAKLAQIANDNLQRSLRVEELAVKQNMTEERFDSFVEKMREEIDANGKVVLNKNIYLNSIEDDAFRFKGDKWEYHSAGLRMKFSDLLTMYNEGLDEKDKIKRSSKLSPFPKDKAIYYLAVLERFDQFIKSTPAKPALSKKTIRHNYCLIIDEINRANLSSVLGELIYALEYRGEVVEGLYPKDGDNRLVLPPNLFIIGTMNTADRSVGHIDYAIRRRFAFLDVPPKDLKASMGERFDHELYHKVAELFSHETYLSPEFDTKDVQLGHSYFIDQSQIGGSMQLRLEHEIRPILLEYVKDGILIGEDVVEKINLL